jgi:hypothetical protein
MTAPILAPNVDPTSSAARMEVKLHRSFEVILEDGGDATKTLRILQAQLTEILAAFNKLLDPSIELWPVR